MQDIQHGIHKVKAIQQEEEIAEHIVQVLNDNLVFIGTESQLNRVRCSYGVKFHSPSFLHAAALIKAADVVISPDTSIVHLCKVYDKKLICLYNNKVFGCGNQNNIVWGPGYNNAVQILSPGKRVDEIAAADLCAAISDAQSLTLNPPLASHNDM